jgi:cytochrome b
MNDVQEFFAKLTLVRLLLHVGGVTLRGFPHRENLVRSMVTGERGAEPE